MGTLEIPVGSFMGNLKKGGQNSFIRSMTRNQEKRENNSNQANHATTSLENQITLDKLAEMIKELQVQRTAGIATNSGDKGTKLYDPGYLNTAPVRSFISYIVGDARILRSRGHYTCNASRFPSNGDACEYNGCTLLFHSDPNPALRGTCV
ncbi:Citrate synthase 3 [Nymphaea thermarum]|nr:Citrate synthase 3 [Nymphaea thermarum]